jgi:hypothetical protein
MIHNCSLMVSCTSRRFQRWFLVDSELHTAQSYAHTVNNTVPYDAYAYDRMIFFGNATVCEDPIHVYYRKIFMPVLYIFKHIITTVSYVRSIGS